MASSSAVLTSRIRRLSALFGSDSGLNKSGRNGNSETATFFRFFFAKAITISLANAPVHYHVHTHLTRRKKTRPQLGSTKSPKTIPFPKSLSARVPKTLRQKLLRGSSGPENRVPDFGVRSKNPFHRRSINFSKSFS